MPKLVDKDKLLEGLTMDATQRATMDALLADPTNHEAMSRRFLRRDEGTRITQAAQTAQEAAAAKVQEAEAYAQELRDWEQQNKGTLNSYKTYIQTLGIPEERVLSGAAAPAGVAAPVVTAPAAPAYNPEQFKKDFVSRSETAEAMKILVDLPFHLQTISQRHQALYGAPPPPEKLEELKTEYLAKGGDIQGLAANTFHFGERQEALAQEKLQSDTTRMAEEKFQQLVSERGLPSAFAGAPESPLFGQDFAQATKLSDPAATNEQRLAHFNQEVSNLASRGIGPTL